MGNTPFLFLLVLLLHVILIAAHHTEVLQQFRSGTDHCHNEQRNKEAALLRIPGSEEGYQSAKHLQNNQDLQNDLEMRLYAYRPLSRIQFIAHFLHEPCDILVIEQGRKIDDDIENRQADIDRREHDARRTPQTDNRKETQGDGNQCDHNHPDRAENEIDHLENSDRTCPALSKSQPNDRDCLKDSDQHKRQGNHEHIKNRSGRKSNVQRKSINDLLYRFRGYPNRFQYLRDHGLPVRDSGPLLEDPVEGRQYCLKHKARQDRDAQLAQPLRQFDDHQERC